MIQWKSPYGPDQLAYVGKFKLQVRRLPDGWVWEIGVNGVMLWRSTSRIMELQQAQAAAVFHLRMELGRCLLILPEEAA